MQKIYDKVENRPERIELNLYIVGDDKDNEDNQSAVAEGSATA